MRVGVRVAFQFCVEAPLEVVRREGVMQGTAGPTCRCAQLLMESVQRVQGGSPHTEPRKDVPKAGSERSGADLSPGHQGYLWERPLQY